MDHRWPQDYLNIKCVIFSIYVALAYWFVPKSKYVLLYVINWLLTQWYTSSYECQRSNAYLNAAIAMIGTFILHRAPARNITTLVLALYLPYIVMAWLDYGLRCSFKMNPTIFPFGRWVYLPFKPPPYKKKFETLDPKVLANIRAFDKYVAILVLILVTLYVVRR